MARFSKFVKRAKNFLIDGIEFKVSKREIYSHHIYNITRLIIMYKGNVIVNYPQAEDRILSNQMYWYGGVCSCALTLFDAYFSKKHFEAFNFTAQELYIEFWKKKKVTQRYMYYADKPSDPDFDYFFCSGLGEKIFKIYRVTDRRVGQKYLKRLKVAESDTDILKIITDRLLLS